MDPTTTWQQLLAKLNENNAMDALFLVEELQEYKGQGGQLPEYLSTMLLGLIQASLYGILDDTELSDLDNEAYGS